MLDKIEMNEGIEVLDLGSRLGGPARLMTSHYSVNVTGIDITPEFIDISRILSQKVGLQINFKVGNILSIPYVENKFKVATLFHVGMNIPDKNKLFKEVARVLVSNGYFAIYDIIKSGKNLVKYPLPWLII